MVCSQIGEKMAHTMKEKEELILRIGRIRGQLNAAEKALTEERDCSEILHALTACKGAMGSLIFKVLEDHVSDHVLTGSAKERKAAADELVGVIKSYLR
jgi:FrmR/RcnR family transcriptional regulator, repressor of frmRAB operon